MKDFALKMEHWFRDHDPLHETPEIRAIERRLRTLFMAFTREDET